ncbi:hypothetical protein [Rathayibacter agropyri]|uniref:hypothetical protein n=1 Tax=Rathayibacter agropyri TaxID=1634927 RepID=UPI0015660E85|nr:hypothetical protein [Rathayibacter agropyri]NRD08802.1 hypothetical protein [Rathayibacter agropyri]
MPATLGAGVARRTPGSERNGRGDAPYAVCGTLLLERGLSAVAAMGAQFGAAALLALPLLVLRGPERLAGSIPTVLWLGVVTVVVAYTFFRSWPAGPPRGDSLDADPAGAGNGDPPGCRGAGERLTTGAVAGVVVLMVVVLLLAVPGRVRRSSPGL